MTSSSTPEVIFPPEVFREDKVDPLFKMIVDYGFDKRKGHLIENHNTTDAWYLFQKILVFAAKRNLPVTLVTGKMLADFYNCLTEELNKLIERGVPVQAYLTEIRPGKREEFLRSNQFAQRLNKASAENPEAYTLAFMKPTEEEIPHVLYAGENGMAFRLERDPDTHEAVAAFGPKKDPLGKVAVDMILPYIKRQQSFQS